MKIKPGETQAVIQLSKSLIRLIENLPNNGRVTVTVQSITQKIGMSIEKGITLCTDMESCEVIGDVYISLMKGNIFHLIIFLLAIQNFNISNLLSTKTKNSIFWN